MNAAGLVPGDDIGEPTFHPSTTEAPGVTPSPSGATPRKPSAPKGKAAPRKRGRPPKAAAAPRNVGEMAAEAAAAATAKEARTAGRPSTVQVKNDAMEAGLRNFYIGAGAMLRMGGLAMNQPRMMASGGQMIAQAADCAAALVVWSNSSPAVRRALESITVAGGASVVIAAHAPIALALMGFDTPEPIPSAAPAGPAADGDEPIDLASLAAMGAALFGGFGAPES